METIKIFLIDWSAGIFSAVAENLKRKGIDIVYWTGALARGGAVVGINKNDFPETIFHCAKKAQRNIFPAAVDVSDFEPLSAELIKRLSGYERQELSMLQRTGFMEENDFPFSKRKHFYYECLWYWNGVLQKLKPTAIIFPNAPHLSYDFVIYSLAKFYGIKTIMFDGTRIPDRMLLIENVEKESRILTKELLANKENVRLEDLTENARNFYSAMVREKKTYQPFTYDSFIKDKKEKRRLFPYIPPLKLLIKFASKAGVRSILTKFFEKIFINLKYNRKIKEWEKIKDELKKEYLALQQEPDLKKKFIFVALNKQPECMINPMGDVFDDHWLIIDILAKSLPKDWRLYVKEHPHQLRCDKKGKPRAHQGRFKGYYQDLADYDNVRLIPIEYQSIDLILNCQAVACINGTVGWEAVFKGKPALVFGYPAYRSCEGVFKVSNLEECQEAINKIVQGYKPDKQKVLNFLAALDRACVKARFSDSFQKEFTVSRQDCVRNIADAIWQELLR